MKKTGQSENQNAFSAIYRRIGRPIPPREFVRKVDSMPFIV